MREPFFRKVVTFGTVFLLGLLTGMMVSHLENPENALSDWQTLVAGFLAIGAAYLTIAQMQRTDLEQMKRHNELVRLNLRSDRLRVLRAADGPGEALQSVGQMLRNEAEACASGLTPPWKARDDASFERLTTMVGYARNVSGNGAFAKAEDLFGPAMTSDYVRMGAWAKQLEAHYQQLSRAMQAGQSHEAITEYFVRTAKMLDVVADAMIGFADHLESLAREYR